MENTLNGKSPQFSGNKVERDDKGRFVNGHTKLGGREVGKLSYSTEMDIAITEYAKLNNLKPEDVKLRIYMKGAGEALKGNFPFYKDFMDRVHGSKDNIGVAVQVNFNELKDKYA